MLKSVRLKNFKLHEDTSIEAAPITVFIGPNNSGKSSIFQALLALRQAAKRGSSNFLQPFQRNPTSVDQPYLYPPTETVDLGEFKHVLRQSESEIRIAATGTIHPGKIPKPVGPVELSLEICLRDNGLFHHSGSLSCRHGGFKWEWSGPFLPPAPQITFQVEDYNLHFSVQPGFRLIELSGYAPTTSKHRGEMASIEELGRFFGNAPLSFLESLHPIFSLRGFEEWGYPLPVSAAATSERLAFSDRTIATASILAYDRDLEESLSERLQELLGIGIKAKLVPPKRVAIWASTSGEARSGTLFVNEGTGANQLPFILLPIALTPKHETILLSEPEAHLHPKMQSDVTGMLLKLAREENIQFFIETHSEHVLHKLLHAVAQQELGKDDLAIYYFENEKGTAKVRKLAINDRGQVDGGLPGFFDQSLTELSEYLDALKKT